jgi:hypothetical protein
MLSMQCIGTCATRKNLKRIQDLLDNKCLNCNHPRETNNHLNRCPEAGQTLLFQYSVAALTRWMNNHNPTDTELAYWIEKYLIFRGTRSFTSLVNAGGGGSSQMLTAVAGQDLVGWTEFLHGKVYKEIGRIQEVHSALSPCRIMNTDWMKSLVTHLIHISHSQWSLWNFTLHNKQCGYLRLQQCRDLLWEVDSLLDTPPEEVLEESRYLLELAFLTLYNATFEQQSYWVLAMKATRRAGQWRAQTVKHQQGSKKCHTAAQHKPSRL